MKTVCNLDMCTGCMLCCEICPKDAITIKDDFLHYNALINENKCISCNICENYCPQNNLPVLHKPFWYKQGWSNNIQQREVSSSGGVATELMRVFLKEGGIVCSCKFQDGAFKFDLVDSTDKLKCFSGSKYVKSNPYGVYKIIKEKISHFEKVLFIGLPCQVASLINYVGYSEYLYTIDLICHGTPSPKVLKEYLFQQNILIDRNINLSFRNKQEFKLFKDNNPIENGRQDNYMAAFLSGLSYTDNCYKCQYAKFYRVSDITLGDSWGSSLPKDEIRKGISLILCQSEKGIDLVKKSNVSLFDVNIDKAINANQQLIYPSLKPRKRDYFLKKVRSGKNINRIMFRVCPKNEIKNNLKRLLTFLRLR